MFVQILRVSILLTVALVVPSALAQTASPDVQNKPRKVKSEPDNSFKRWVVDVEPIITSEELKAWNKLQTNEEREQFISEFWHRRDTDTDTDQNEYREAYYERVAYANEHFSSGIPGVKSDRGRIFLKYGKPDEIESHPAGVLMNGSHRKAVVRLRLILSSAGGTAIFRVVRTSRSSSSIPRAPANIASRATRLRRKLC